jgi:hypothetical protein
VELLSGFNKAGTARARRPDLGSVISKLRSSNGPRHLPPYVALDRTVAGGAGNGPAYLGGAHQFFFPGSTVENLGLARGLTLERLADRKALLGSFEQLRRNLEDVPLDAFTAQAFDLLSSPKTRDAFDIGREPENVRARYGDGDATRLLQARRLVEAGVPVVTLTFGSRSPRGDLDPDICAAFSWDTHNGNFKCLRRLIPRLDQAIHALITDLHERGLDKDVAVVIGGEMGRRPLIGGTFMSGPDGRDHWPQAGFSLIAGGGLRMGQVIGQTDQRAERAFGNPYTPQNVLATLYHVLGVDLKTTTLPDRTGRPMALLDDCNPIAELV